MPSALVPLANYTTTGNQLTITFSSIGQSYRDLMLVCQSVMAADTGNGMKITVNSDSATNYNYVWMSGNGSTATSSSLSTRSYIQPNASIVTTPTITTMHIMDYSATDKHKSMLIRQDATWASDPQVAAYAARWASTSAITTVTISLTGTTGYGAGSTFALYGVSA